MFLFFFEICFLKLKSWFFLDLYLLSHNFQEILCVWIGIGEKNNFSDSRVSSKKKKDFEWVMYYMFLYAYLQNMTSIQIRILYSFLYISVWQIYTRSRTSGSRASVLRNARRAKRAYCSERKADVPLRSRSVLPRL